MTIDTRKLLHGAGYTVTVHAHVGGRGYKAFSRVSAHEFRLHGVIRGVRRAIASVVKRAGA
jgi:hypothetical protein